MIILFDLDPAVYMSAFAAQSSEYELVWEDEDGQVSYKQFKDGNEKNAFKREIVKDGCTILEDTKVIIEEELSHATQCAKTLISRALRRIKKEFKVDDVQVEYYLTGKGNFREEVATIAKYKGNRDEMVKPVHYQSVRDFLIDSYGAYVVDLQEADDAVSIRAWELWKDPSTPDYIVASIDKDLDQIPGWHYDYKKHVFYDVDELDAELFFYAQILAGDSTDNIKGCYRVGLTKARKLVDEWFDEGGDEFRAYICNKIVEEYEANMAKYPDKYPEGITAEDAVIENARLVYMRQKRDELWNLETT